MKWTLRWIMSTGLMLAHAGIGLSQDTVFETTSPYHHIRVADHGRLRILHFNHTTQSQISLDDPLQGHFEYTEYFHMPWLWNDQIKSVLMIGLGGSSVQRAYQAYWPQVETETVELDPKVVEVAREALAKGAFDFLAKPFKPQDLSKIIKRAEKELGTDR